MHGDATHGPSVLERILKRDRLLVASALILVFVAALAYTLAGVGMEMSAIAMTRMILAIPGMAMTSMAWTASSAVLVFLMWWVMMIAMMTPSAAPVVLIHAAVARKQTGVTSGSTTLFAAGYLVVWAAFSLVATAAQFGLESFGAATGMMEIASPAIAGAILMAAGLYQLTPLKQACLNQCRHPLQFIMGHWRPGRAGAFAMGLDHGRFCVGCCWFLMALLFVGGIMNLIWIAGIAVFVAVEKFSGQQRLVTAGSGIVLMAAGAAVLAKSYLSA